VLDAIRVAVIGAGRFAHLAVLPILRRLPAVQLIGITGRTPEKLKHAAALFNSPQTFLSVEELLAGAAFDAAVVCTPPDAHAAQVTALLEAGKDVCCEKPLAPTITEMETMVALAKAKGRVFMVGLNRRYAPVCVRAKDHFASRRIDLCVVEKHKDSLDRRALFTDGIHMIDFMRWVCGGRGRVVSATVKAEDPDREATLAAVVEFEAGPLGVFLMNRRAGRWIERATLHGSGCSMEVQFPDSTMTHQGGETSLYEFRPKDWAWAVDMLEKGGFQQELEDFVQCVRTRGTPRAPAEDAVESHRMVDTIYRMCGLAPLD
jgi:virulence factor